MNIGLLYRFNLDVGMKLYQVLNRVEGLLYLLALEDSMIISLYSIEIDCQ